MSVLVVFEIALTLVLLTGNRPAPQRLSADQRGESWFSRREPSHYDGRSVSESLYKTTAGIQAFHARTLENLSNLPGILSAVSAINFFPSTVR